ncbi:phosphotransferase [Streptomyces sp. NPDC056105]|uniref:phosphotransferase n=1 Tax=Streptomyces sp. NPDC056105 TaxID=3345714 RepID=UPI0035DFA881
MATTDSADARPAIGEALVRRLVDRDSPQWAGLPVKLVDPAGSDHVIHRLGDELLVRLPRSVGVIGQAAKESEWLPRLAPHLPLAVPVPVGVGKPGFGYPWPWSVSRWLEGEVATVEASAESSQAAVELAEFLLALQRFTPEAGPAEAARDGVLDDAGGSLADRDAARAAAERAGDPQVLHRYRALRQAADAEYERETGRPAQRT